LAMMVKHFAVALSERKAG